ncbi:hypothetical protein EYC59_02060 [Candidatus Saccharibacteria bacterium]|nr:MAG: hypothetical protein EYC59_02060 [Candidatus Saccharibacteria bacterium]
MAYQFPLNGGRLNASINPSGNTAGVPALVSTGTLHLAGGNNITLSQNGASVTISGANAPSGSINFSAGTTSGNFASVTFANSNGVSFGLNGGTITGTVATTYAASNHSHGNPTLALTNLSGTTASASNGLTLSLSAAPQSAQTIGGYITGNTIGQSSSSTFDARSMSLSALGGASAGFSAGILQVSAPAVSSLSYTGIIDISTNGNTISIGAPAVSIGMSNIGNTSGTSGTASNQLIFAGGNNITLSQSTGAGGNTLSIAGPSLSNSNGFTFGTNGSVITASYNGLTSQSNQALSASNGSFAFQTAGFSNANGVTFGTSAGSIMTASVNTSYAASNHSHGNPALNLTNLSGTTASASNGLTLSLSVAAQSVQTQSNIQGIIASGSTNRTGDISFVNSNGVTFGLSNNSITASIQPGAAAGIGAIANSNATYTSGTVNLLEGGGAITIATTTGSKFNFSVPQTSSLSGAGGLTISTTNNNTITLSTPPAGSMVRWEYPNQAFSTLTGGIGQSSLSLQHVYIPFYLTGSSARIAASISAGSLTTTGATQTVNISLHMGIYTLSGSTLSSVSTASALNSFSYTQSNTQGISNYNSLREITAPLTVNVTPGEYWVAALVQTASTGNSGFGMTMMGDNQLHVSNANIGVGVLGAALTASGQPAYMGQGIFSAQTAAMPSSIVVSAINHSSGTVSNAQRAAFYHAFYSATY